MGSHRILKETRPVCSMPRPRGLEAPPHEPVDSFAFGVYADRALGGDRDHRGLDRLAAAGRAIGTGVARRTQCINNLKQLGLAVQSYITSANVFPAQTLDNVIPPGGPEESCNGLPRGPQACCLTSNSNPCTMRSTSASRCSSGPPPIYGANTTVGLTSISTLLCPSESLSKSPSFAISSSSTTGYTGQFAVSNYAGNYGGPAMIKACSGTIIPVTGNNLAFQLMAAGGETAPLTGGPVRIQTITDGAATTALFSEHLLAYTEPPGVTDPGVTPGGVLASAGCSRPP